MKDVKINSLTSKQRKLLQIGVLILLAFFLILFFFFQSKGTTKRNEVFLENSQLQVFDDTYTFNGYPDKILIHYPYFLLVQANKPLTTIYNLEAKEKVKEVKDVLLDYYDGHIVYNRKETYFNDKNLGEFCDSAFIKSTNEVLCITKRSRDSIDNMLISINPDKPNLWKQVYQSKNFLTTVTVIGNDLYLGEINVTTKQNYVSKNSISRPIDSVVNIIYSIGKTLYYAGYKSQLNQGKQSFYEFESGKSALDSIENKIVFYR